MRTKYIKAVLLTIAIAVTSCQRDIDIDTSENNANDDGSVFTSKVKRTSMFDGAFDDVLDANACYAVQLPVNILLNGLPITINTLADLDLILPLDLIAFSFPITVNNYNHTQTTIGSQAELDALSASCDALIAANEGPLNCIDFSYPLTLYTASSGQAQSEFEINSDTEIYNFIENLDSTTKYSFKYPLNIIDNESQIQLEVNNDIDLQLYIESCLN
jgi:hypothetical protein